MDNSLSLGKILRNLRDEKGVTQDDLAELLSVKRQTYSAYERDVSLPDAKTLGVLAGFFGVSADFLLGLNNQNFTAANADVDDEMTEILDEFRRNPQLRTMFSLSKNATPDELRQYMNVIRALRGETDF